MPKLILVKHSMPEIAVDCPSNQWGLSAEGRRRCLPLASRLAAFYPSKIISSPEPKAMETAQRVGQKLGLPVLMNDRLHEHKRVSTGYLPAEQYQQSMQNFFRRPEECVFGEESAVETQVRFAKAIWRILDQHPQQTLAIVAHGTVISLFAASCAHLESYELWRRLGLPSFVVLRLPDLTLDEIIENVCMERRPAKLHPPVFSSAP
jgi:broad specificity phosphatase PhoE